MQAPPIPPDEPERLAALRSYDILDSEPERAYDDLVRIAAHLLGMPIALVSLVDAERQWFKARIGLDDAETSREASFCAHAVAQRRSLVVPDALEDPRFIDNPLVVGPPRIRFYAGAPLQSPQGHLLGTLCVIDRQPRALEPELLELLEALARQAVNLLELRRRAAEAERTAAELREAHLAAEAANKAKSDFLANMSHELRTPLNSVIGFTNILLKNKSGALGPRELDYLGRIGTNGDHLLRLINDVLDLSKIEAGRLEVLTEEVDIGAVVQRVVEQLQGHAHATRTRLGVDMPARLRPLRIDPHRLEQVLINLVGNALKFTADGTVEVRIRADAAGTPVRLDVLDDGIGIPADKHALIFESFRQADESTRRRFGGTGLGLAISRSLCEVMGLRLELASEEGRGSLFAVSLADHDLSLAYEPPHQSAAPAAAREQGPAQAPATPSRCTVLVIDDDADARAVLESFLQDYGCQIVAADSGERGIELARQLRPDLVTLDLMMPHMDGWSVLEAMREDPQLRAIPVVVCSIVGGESRASLQGAIAVMDKPIAREELYAVLRKHLADPSRSASIEDVLAQALGQGPRSPR